MSPTKKKSARGGRREGAGRPSKPEGEVLTHDLRGRVREDEYEAARAAAERAEVSISEFVRRAVAEKARKSARSRKSTQT